MNVPNYEECVKYALEMKGIVGDTFKDTNLRVYNRRTANPGTVFTALRKGGIVIPVVNASLLGEYNVEETATVVIKADRQVPMSTILEVKQALRRARALRICYGAQKETNNQE